MIYCSALLIHFMVTKYPKQNCNCNTLYLISYTCQFFHQELAPSICQSNQLFKMLCQNIVTNHYCAIFCICQLRSRWNEYILIYLVYTHSIGNVTNISTNIWYKSTIRRPVLLVLFPTKTYVVIYFFLKFKLNLFSIYTQENLVDLIIGTGRLSKSFLKGLYSKVTYRVSNYTE